jgi:hypothetical protein
MSVKRTVVRTLSGSDAWFQNAQRTLVSLVTTESNVDSGAVDKPVVRADDARR